jgi:hypothetical protein
MRQIYAEKYTKTGWWTMPISLDEPFWIGDRCFTPDDVKTIQQIVYRTRRFSRNEIIATVCENMDWKAPNGHLKMAASRVLMLEMESKQHITWLINT